MRLIDTFFKSTCALAICGFFTAGAIDRTQDRGRRVLNEAVAALGGPQFLAMRDRVETGWTSSWHGSKTRHVRTKIYTLYDESTPEILERRAFDKDESYGVVFNETGGYEVTWRGARPLSEEKIADFREELARNIFHILRHRLNDPGLIVEYRGADKCENQAADLVDITDAENRVTTVCFSQATRLPIRQSYYRRNPVTKDRIEHVTIFSRYTEADGVVWPRMIQRLRDGDPVTAVVFETVSVNQSLSKDRFAIPELALTGR